MFHVVLGKMFSRSVFSFLLPLRPRDTKGEECGFEQHRGMESRRCWHCECPQGTGKAAASSARTGEEQGVWEKRRVQEAS